MKAYNQYAEFDSPWLGAFPSHWRVSRFGYEAVINGGQVDPRDEPWRSMTLVAPNHIEGDTGRVIGRESAGEQGADSGKYVVRSGQLMYSKIRPRLNKVAMATEDCLCSADMYAMSFRPSVSGRYAFYYMLARPFHSFATVTSMRVKMPKINRDELSSVPWLVPRLDEQYAIAAYLDRETAKIDTLIEEQQRLIEMLRERRTATIAEQLPEVDGTRLKRVATVQSGVTLSGEGDPDDPEWPYLRVANVQVGRVEFAELRTIRAPETVARAAMLRTGDVLMTEGGDIDKLGRGALWAGDVEPMLHQNHIFAVRTTERLDPEYLVYWLDGPVARTYFRTTAKKTTNLAATNKWTLGNLPVACPPFIEQRRIAAYLDERTAKIDELIAEAERFIELSKERRDALITAAVTGQIDVREAA